MKRLRALLHRWLYGPSDLADLERELQDHFDLDAGDLTETGCNPGEARFLAHRNLGNTARIKEMVYAHTRIGVLDNGSKGLRRSLRSLLRQPAFTAAAILSIALGIGGTTAIFTLIDAITFRSLPVSEPARLYRVGDGDDTIAEGRHGNWGFYSFPLYQRLKAGTPEFEDITAFDWGGNQLSVRRQGAADAARPLLVEYATGTYFSTLGVSPFAGRVFIPDDDRASAPPVAVMSYDAWQGVYGADQSIIGSTLLVQGHPFTVVGIAAPEFFGESVRAYRPDIWIPLQQEPVIAGNGSLLRQSTPSWLVVIGRLRTDGSIVGMAPRLTQILHHWIQYESQYPSEAMADITRDLPKQIIRVVAAGNGIGLGGLSLKEQYGSSLRILLAACGLVLIIASANVANLLLARAVAQRTQTAVRVAIGATRWAIVAEAITESLLLAMAGGLAGLAVAVGLARLLVALAFHGAQFVPITTTPSAAVLMFTAGLSLLTAIAFGAAPAYLATGIDPIEALRGSGRVVGADSSRARTSLLILQAMFSVAVIAGAIMLAQSFANLKKQDLGYPVQGRILVGLNRLPATYTLQKLSSLYRDTEQRLETLPGIHGVGLAAYNPLTSFLSNATVVIEGHALSGTVDSGASWNRVSGSYLQNLGVTTIRGRLFAADDNETTTPVAVVNESFAKRFFADNEDPIGQRFGIDRIENAATFRIVGIVRDAKFARALNRQPAPMFFLPLTQHVDYRSDQGNIRLVEALSHLVEGIILVTDFPPADLEPVLRRTLAQADPNFTITYVRTMRQQIDTLLNQERAVTTLAELFAVVALALAAIGVYGVMAYMVAQQTNEIGIRMALGAHRGTVIRLILSRAFKPIAIGLILGLPLAVAAGKFMAAQLYGVTFWDAFALVTAAGLVIVCVSVATLIPAARAAAISPMSALRTE